MTDQAELTEIKETFNKQVSDLRESGIREKNVIIHQVKEGQEKDGPTRKKSDTDFGRAWPHFWRLKIMLLVLLG